MDAIGGAVLGKRELIHKIKWPSMPYLQEHVCTNDSMAYSQRSKNTRHEGRKTLQKCSGNS